MNTLIAAYDSTDEANAALDVALQLARAQRASVVACYAVDLSAEVARIAAAFHYTPASAVRTLREDAKAVLDIALKRAAAAKTRIRTKFIDAPVVAGITEYARRARADMIVVGSRGRSGLPRLVLGSVAEGIMRHASVPVLVVRAQRGAKGAPSRARRARTR